MDGIRFSLYGQGWRKDFFRSLVNVNYSGPYAAAHLTRSGELTVLFSDPWDRQMIPGAGEFTGAFPQASAIAGLELMEAALRHRLRPSPPRPMSRSSAASRPLRKSHPFGQQPISPIEAIGASPTPSKSASANTSWSPRSKASSNPKEPRTISC